MFGSAGLESTTTQSPALKRRAFAREADLDFAMPLRLDLPHQLLDLGLSGSPGKHASCASRLTSWGVDFAAEHTARQRLYSFAQVRTM